MKNKNETQQQVVKNMMVLVSLQAHRPTSKFVMGYTDAATQSPTFHKCNSCAKL